MGILSIGKDVQTIKSILQAVIPLMLIFTFLVGITNPPAKKCEQAVLNQTNGSLQLLAQLDTAQAETAKTQDSAAVQAKIKLAEDEAAQETTPAPDIKTATSTSSVKTASNSVKRVASAPAPSRSQTANSTASASTTTKTAPAPSSTSGSQAATKASAIINTAKQYIGVKYLWGGTTPSGFDCSGYMQYVFAKHGITLPRVSRDQFNAGKAVAYDNLQPGDLVFFSLDGDKVTDHVGMYIGSGQFIHASSSKGVTISTMSSYWKSKYLGARRVI